MKTLKNNKGFTLLETILTTIILSVGLVGAMTTTQNATAHSVYSDQQTVATYLANAKVEDVLADKAFQGYNYVLANNYSVDDFAADYPAYTMTVSKYEVDGSDLATASSGSGYMKITVQIQWGNSSGEQVQLSTLLANY